MASVEGVNGGGDRRRPAALADWDSAQLAEKVKQVSISRNCQRLAACITTRGIRGADLAPIVREGSGSLISYFQTQHARGVRQLTARRVVGELSQWLSSSGTTCDHENNNALATDVDSSIHVDGDGSDSHRPQQDGLESKVVGCRPNSPMPSVLVASTPLVAQEPVAGAQTTSFLALDSAADSTGDAVATGVDQSAVVGHGGGIEHGDEKEDAAVAAAAAAAASAAAASAASAAASAASAAAAAAAAASDAGSVAPSVAAAAAGGGTDRRRHRRGDDHDNDGDDDDDAADDGNLRNAVQQRETDDDDTMEQQSQPLPHKVPFLRAEVVVSCAAIVVALVAMCWVTG